MKMKKIIITVGGKKMEASLNGTKTAKNIYNILPIEAEANFWGNEIYFSINMAEPNEKPTLKLSVGDLAYWPPGNALCIFFGQTPASKGEEPKPASPVTVVGKINEAESLEFLTNLRKVNVRVEKKK